MGEFLCFKFKMVFGIISIHVGMVEVLGQFWYLGLFVHVTSALVIISLDINQFSKKKLLLDRLTSYNNSFHDSFIQFRTYDICTSNFYSARAKYTLVFRFLKRMRIRIVLMRILTVKT